MNNCHYELPARWYIKFPIPEEIRDESASLIRVASSGVAHLVEWINLKWRLRILLSFSLSFSCIDRSPEDERSWQCCTQCWYGRIMVRRPACKKNIHLLWLFTYGRKWKLGKYFFSNSNFMAQQQPMQTFQRFMGKIL